MKKSSILTLAISCFALLFVGFVSGYYIANNYINEKPNDQFSQDNIEEHQIPKITDEHNNDSDITIASDDECIGPNTIIEYVTYYEECEHTLTTSNKAEEEIVNMKEDEFEKYIESKYLNSNIEFFSRNKIIVKMKKNHLCPNHFVIGVKDGKIAIYEIDEEGNRVLSEIVDIPISILKEIDQKKLEKGIVTDSEDEKISVLENYIS